MQLIDDRAYYRKRASDERALARECTDHAVTRIHLALAEEYDRKADGETPGYRPLGVPHLRSIDESGQRIHFAGVPCAVPHRRFV